MAVHTDPLAQSGRSGPLKGRRKVYRCTQNFRNASKTVMILSCEAIIPQSLHGK